MGASSAPIDGRLRARRDLSITPSGDGWVVKDPLSLEYFRVGPRERCLLELLSEPLDLAELTRRYAERFPNERATPREVLAFCASLRECSLLVGGAKAKPGGAARLLGLLNPLAIRLPGFDPTPLLDATAWLGRVLFSWSFLAVLLLSALPVAVGLVGSAEELAQELGRLADLLRPEYAAAAVVAVLVTKSWHEVGHAMACRRVSVECHEVGVMLLALAPCLYCDASDAWALPSRAKRALVALAGVYFELILAVLAAATWLLLAPGPLRVLAMYVVVVSTASTLLVNLNPLVRYDGYYLLADLWGVANLREQSRDALWGGLRRWVRGDRTPSAAPQASPIWLAVYGALSFAYGLLLLTLILRAVHGGLTAVGFRSAGDLLVALSLGGLALAGGRSMLSLFRRGPNGRWLGTSARLALLTAIVAVVGYLVASTPIDQTLRSPCRLVSAERFDLIAPSEGLLVSHAAYGDTVEPGDLIAELEDPRAELRRFELLEREASLAAELAGLVTRSQSDAGLLAEIARIKPQLAEVRRQLRTDQTLAERRRLRAPIAGRLRPPAPRFEESPLTASDGELSGWSGGPLDAENAGCVLAEGDPLGRIAGGELRAVVLLEEHDSGLVRLGDPVRLILDRDPGTPLEGCVEAVALAAADERVEAGERELERALRGELETTSAFRLTVSLERQTPACQPGALGTARVVTGRETLGEWLLRRLRRLVRFG